MLPNEYQKLAIRTECNQAETWKQFSRQHPVSTRLTHSVLGLTGEVGELASAIEKWLYYGQVLDFENVLEELGDSLWYIAQACTALGVTLDDVMQMNISKLQVRYPKEFESCLTEEKERDQEEEEKAFIGDYGRTAARFVPLVKESTEKQTPRENPCRTCTADSEDTCLDCKYRR